MRKWFILLASAAAMTAFAPASSSAQGIGIELPGVGVHIGEPNRHRRHYDGPRYRERDVYLSRRDCRTVTIERDDGSVKRIRRCD